MTRINTIDPDLLPTPWLMAEYRELPRILNRVVQAPFPLVPATYRMGAGHVSFFGDKLTWLTRRHYLLREELRERGCKPLIQVGEIYDKCLATLPHLCHDWTPMPADHTANLLRLIERWADGRGKAFEAALFEPWMAKVLTRYPDLGVQHKLMLQTQIELVQPHLEKSP